jgi:hypothetical protein
VSVALLAAGSLAIYRRTFSVPLLFDDTFSITENPTIRKLWPLWPVFSPPDFAGVGGRPLLNLSYALNYAVGGTSVFSYHLVNLAIHFLAGCTLFALVRRTLRLPTLAETLRRGRHSARFSGECPLVLAPAADRLRHLYLTAGRIADGTLLFIDALLLRSLRCGARAVGPSALALGRPFVSVLPARRLDKGNHRDGSARGFSL